MEPYFYSITNNIISDQLKKYALKFAETHKDEFISYVMKERNILDGNNYYKFDLLNYEEVNKLKDTCSLDFYVFLIMHKPNDVVIIHKDGPFKRNCVLSIPLSPNKNYAETNFYNKDQKLVTSSKFENMKPAFLNTQEFHGLVNNNNYRFNLQLCFEESFETVVTMYKLKKLFNFQ